MRSVALLIAVILLSPIPVLSVDGKDRTERASPPRAVSFTDVGATAFDQTSAPTFISTVDWNNDGYQDLLFNGNRLFRNNGPPFWNFTLQTSVFGSSTSGSRNGIWADWDGDGDQDLYQGCSQGNADRFWENQGSPDFKLVDVSTGVFGSWRNLHPNTGNSWGDFDRDGDLDLYVGNGEDWNDGNPIYFPDYFLRNENGQTFTDISSTAGMRTGENFYSRGVTWGDYNNDHWQDAYVSHYRIRENHLFENQMDGTFDEVGQERNCSGTYANDWYYDSTAGGVYGQYWWGPNWGHTIGSAWADLNRDGNLDLWTSDFVHKYVGYIGTYYDIRGYICDDGNLYINDGAPYYNFQDFRNTSGIPRWPVGGQGTYRGDQTFSGVAIGDYDNDGWEDIYIPQVYGDLPYTTPHLYRNKGYVLDGSVPDGTTFEDVTDSLGIVGANTYACLWLDYDNDGDLDLVTGGADTWDGSNWQNYRVRLYQNQGTGNNRFIKVQLNGTGSNPNAIGARVTMGSEQINNSRQILLREVRAGTGHAHQESNILHFGLGSNLYPELMDLYSLQVAWPDGNVEWVRVRESNTILYINQPSQDLYPKVNSVTVIPREPREDESVTITVDASPNNSPIHYYLWDFDSNNHYDALTSSNSISFIPRQGGLKQVRCRVSASDDPANFSYRTEIYPIEIDVENVRPKILLDPSIMIDMDEILFLPDEWIDDTYSDLKNLTWSVSWGDDGLTEGLGDFSPNHTYKVPGEFELVVTVRDEEFMVKGQTLVEVNNVFPWGWVEPWDGNDTVHFEDDLIYFTPTVLDSPSDTGQKRIRWDFGDGTVQDSWSDLSDGAHRYSKVGNYTVKALVRDQYGGEGILYGWVNITNKAPSLVWVDDDPGTLNVYEDSALDLDDLVEGLDTTSDQPLLEYNWDFGNGNESGWRSTPDAGNIYQFSGVYGLTCTVRDDDGDTASLSLNVEVQNVAPQIEEVSSLYDVFEDETVELAVRGKDTPSDRDRLTYELRFPDDHKITSDNGTFRFSLPHKGQYELVVAVIDDDLESDVETVFLNVLNRLPKGEIFTENSSYDEDEEIIFKAVDLWDTSHDIQFLVVTWDFDDDSGPVTAKEAVHTYTRKGRYTVKMSIDDGNDRVVKEKDIVIDNPVPTAVMDVSNLSVDIGFVITFSAAGSSDNPSDVGSLLYLWDFDDGEDAEGMMVTHAFTKAGSYTVVLEVMDDDGAVSYADIVIEVKGAGDIAKPDGSGGSYVLLPVILVIIAVLLIGALIIAGMVLLKRKQVPPAGPPPQMQYFPSSQLPQGYQRSKPPSLSPPAGAITSGPPPPPLPPSPPRSP
ncbi:MAG: PKD domain-containing protein [Thermoplasmatota archaeon]